jgi:hypothetical protein
MTTTWRRIWAAQLTWDVGHSLIANIPSGQTLLRTHFGFTFTGASSTQQNMAALAEDFLVFSVVTQSSTRGSTPPNPRSSGADVNPPLERYLWWGTANMRPMTFGSLGQDITNWSTSAAYDNLSTKGEVLANVPSGDTLDLYLSWAPWATSAWQARGDVVGTAWAAALYST